DHHLLTLGASCPLAYHSCGSCCLLFQQEQTCSTLCSARARDVCSIEEYSKVRVFICITLDTPNVVSSSHCSAWLLWWEQCHSASACYDILARPTRLKPADNCGSPLYRR